MPGAGRGGAPESDVVPAGIRVARVRPEQPRLLVVLVVVLLAGLGGGVILPGPEGVEFRKVGVLPVVAFTLGHVFGRDKAGG